MIGSNRFKRCKNDMQFHYIRVSTVHVHVHNFSEQNVQQTFDIIV